MSPAHLRSVDMYSVGQSRLHQTVWKCYAVVIAHKKGSKQADLAHELRESDALPNLMAALGTIFLWVNADDAQDSGHCETQR